MQAAIRLLDRLGSGNLLYAGKTAKSAKTAARSAATVCWGLGCCQEGRYKANDCICQVLFTQNFEPMQTVAEGGMSSLFRGMGAPFATVAVYNAVLFAARGQMESMLAHADGAALYTLAQVCYASYHPHSPSDPRQACLTIEGGIVDPKVSCADSHRRLH